ncbi:YqjF family protein [Streptomyces sp. HMX112]|uniref:YqjF family protein n=1 Tax=Streptomyces sp. HMX112 TaxID=3390850 RepID=UPI003A7FF72D
MAERGARRVRLAALRCRWLTQCFVHWPYPPEQVQRLLPPGFVADEYRGAAWVSLTPFRMTDVRPHPVPAAPGLPGFPETNLRTYVRRPDGRDGLWFFSLEVTQPLMLGAVAAGAPYRLGRLRVAREGGCVVYSGARYGGGASYRLVVRPGERLAPRPELDVWLTDRWRAYTRRLGVVWEVPAEHEPWPLREAAVESLEENLRAVAGLPPCAEPPLVRYSPGVRDVRLGLLRPG